MNELLIAFIYLLFHQSTQNFVFHFFISGRNETRLNFTVSTFRNISVVYRPIFKNIVLFCSKEKA